MSELLDEDNESDGAELERFDSGGKRVWSFLRKNFSPKFVTVTSSPKERFYFVVMNVEDPQQRLGNLIFAIDEKGKYAFSYSEEARRFDQILPAPPDFLYVSSYDRFRDPRVHAISRK